MKAKDLFGGLVLPGVVPDVSDSTNLPRGIGDPALAIVGSFLATVLLAELGAAAAALWAIRGSIWRWARPISSNAAIATAASSWPAT